ncbi:MAG: SDR family oxidoreductase [Gammaproteobacteria bacterium]|nr:SDR family oxidoreductase [Gammaproteobacteria bacterium]
MPARRACCILLAGQSTVTSMQLRLLLIVGIAWTGSLWAADPAPAAKTVLVTGASTGIGRKITEKLAADGFFVYATARKPEDLKALGSLRNVQALPLDVTEPAEVAALVKAVTEAGRGLDALINNAGIGSVGTVADTSVEEYELVMKVNAEGPWRLIKAFEPLLIEHQGRIVNIGSISGILARENMPTYAMSKHALEALTDSLAVDLGRRGVKVSIVEPGNYNSAIGKNAIARLGAGSAAVNSTGYKASADRSNFKEPDEVAAAVEQALTEPTPKRRYLVVPNAQEAEITIRKQIEQLVQLNEGQPYSYDRTALVKMLDEALATARPPAH